MLRDAYRRAFWIDEIEREPILQWMFGALLLFTFLLFSNWIRLTYTTVQGVTFGDTVCWPYAQGCENLFFLNHLPYGHSQAIFYMCLYGLMLAIVWRMWRKDWIHAHALLVPLLAWEAFVTFVLSYSTAAPYNYYHLIFAAVLLFLPHKEFFLKLTFVFLYFMSVTTKLDPTWILGTYFSPLKTGLPLFPDALIPVLTNVVIFSQVVGCWFLFSSNRLLQRSALAFFTFFHLYSGVFVYYMYPTVALPPLLILFGPMYRHTGIPLSRRAILGWALIIALAIFQLLGFITPGDRRLTLEGNRFGMFMFEANHQCTIDIDVYRTDAAFPESSWEAMPGTPCDGLACLVKKTVSVEDGRNTISLRYESGAAWYRCDPYEWWARYKAECTRDTSIERVALSFDHSINGSPFYRIVDTDDICALDYKLFTHNDWIKTPPEASVVGYPVQNLYRF